jgi:AcrR family transcriptional regulator
MQVQKPEIRDKILTSTLTLIYKQGYRNTTTRQIAGEVGISVSNLYKYFRNKGILLDELVGSFHTRYLTGYREFLSHEEQDTFDDDAGEILGQALFESMKGHCREFVILMDKSQGTKYQGFKKTVISGLVKHIEKETVVHPENKRMVEVLVSNLFNGLTEIAKYSRNDKQLRSHVTLLAHYHLRGISVLFP